MNYNSGPLLSRCVASLMESGRGHLLPPVVVDNASTDTSVTEAVRAFPQLRVRRNASNRGFAAAVNQVVALAGGECFFLLNPDCFLQPGVERMISLMASAPDIGAVGPRLLEADGTPQPSCGALPEVRQLLRHYFPMTRIFPLHGGSSPYLLDPWAIERPRVVGWVRGACMLIRREAWERTGGFDEGFFLYGEEVDWCCRATEAGWKIVYFPGASAVHLGGGSTGGEGALAGRLPYEHEKSLLRLMWRMGGPGATLPLRFFQAASVCLGLIAHGAAVAAGRETPDQWRRRVRITRNVLNLAIHYKPAHLSKTEDEPLCSSPST